MTRAEAMESAQRLKATMQRWGVKCSIELQPGRGSDPWATPIKPLRMHHHTVSTFRPGGNMTPVLGIVKNGRPATPTGPAVPGPLANGYGGFDLVYRIICMGLANHPGEGGPVTIDGIHIPRNSARAPTWGTEFEGGLQPWEEIPGMLEFMGRADGALAEWSARPLTSQMEHKTWAGARKIDRKDFDAERGRGIALTSKFKPGTDAEDEEMAYYTIIRGPNKPPRLCVDGAVIGFSSPEELEEHAAAYDQAGFVRKTVTFTEGDDWDRDMRGRLRE